MLIPGPSLKQLFVRLGASEDYGDLMLNTVASRYLDPSRHYHTLRHIDSFLSEVELLGNQEYALSVSSTEMKQLFVAG